MKLPLDKEKGPESLLCQCCFRLRLYKIILALGLNVPRKIHTCMKNANNINTAFNPAVEQNVRTGRIFIVTGPHFGTCPADRRLRGYCLDVLPE